MLLEIERVVHSLASDTPTLGRSSARLRARPPDIDLALLGITRITRARTKLLCEVLHGNRYNSWKVRTEKVPLIISFWLIQSARVRKEFTIISITNRLNWEVRKTRIWPSCNGMQSCERLVIRPLYHFRLWFCLLVVFKFSEWMCKYCSFEIFPKFWFNSLLLLSSFVLIIYISTFRVLWRSMHKYNHSLSLIIRFHSRLQTDLLQ